eukprot:scaffold102793_cov50-Prasinocladus_malaysianus.AAC.1
MTHDVICLVFQGLNPGLPVAWKQNSIILTIALSGNPNTPRRRAGQQLVQADNRYKPGSPLAALWAVYGPAQLHEVQMLYDGAPGSKPKTWPKLRQTQLTDKVETDTHIASQMLSRKSLWPCLQ